MPSKQPSLHSYSKQSNQNLQHFPQQNNKIKMQKNSPSLLYQSTINRQQHQSYQQENTFASDSSQETSSQKSQQQIKYYLKSLLSERDVIKKLMISCILSNLYIEQYNYQEAHKILIDIQNTIGLLEDQQKKSKNFENIASQNYVDFAIIKLKMYSSFILIQIINFQSKMFELHLEKALQLILSFKNLQPLKNLTSENTDPNSMAQLKSNNQQLMIMLFQFFLKGFTGLQNFQQIQAQTLIAECNTEKFQCSSLNDYFYFSNLSFLKLLSTSDYQSAYKLESYSNQFIQNNIIKTKQNNQSVSLKQVILKTVSLKKLLFLAEELKLPTQIIKNLKQKLNSSEGLQSKYLEGLQQNTIFRNYHEKIDLGFKLISKLKEFERDIIMTTLIEVRQRELRKNQSLNSDVNKNNQLIYWQCKALKNKLIQVLASKNLRNNQKAQQHIILVVQCLDKNIERYRCQNSYHSEGTQIEIPVEERLLLQTIRCTCNLSLQNSGKKTNKKPQQVSIYDVSIHQYCQRLQILIQCFSKYLIDPLLNTVMIKLKQFQSQQQPQIQVQIQTDQETKIKNANERHKNEQIHEKSYQNSESQSQPSIYLENVEFEYVEENTEGNKNQVTPVTKCINEPSQKNVIGDKQIKMDKKVQNKNITANLLLKNQQQKHKPQTESYSQHFSSFSQKNKNSPKKKKFLNDKNEVYLNYVEIGSRIKLNQQKNPIQSNLLQFNSSLRSQQGSFCSKDQSNLNKTYYQQSIKKQEGAIWIPNDDSIVKYSKKYPFEQKQRNQMCSSSLKKSQEQKNSFLKNFQYENRYTTELSKISELQNQKINQQQSISKSRKKQSSLSPKVSKESTIHCKLTDKIQRHELTLNFSRNSIKKIKEEQIAKENSELDYSQGLSPNSQSMIRNKQKVEKSSRIQKSPIKTTSYIQNKTIKFKQYMQNLQKSGIKIKETRKEEQSLVKEQSLKPKIEALASHRQIVIQQNLSDKNYESYMKQAQKIKVTENRNNILDGLFIQPKNLSKLSNVFDMKVLNHKDFNEDNESNQNFSQAKIKKRTESELIKINQQKTLTVQEKNRKQKVQSEKPFKKETQKNLQNSNVSSINHQKELKLLPSLSKQPFSFGSISQYTQKMIKIHKKMLNHAIKLCQNGQYVDKKHYSSDGGEQRFFMLSSDHKFIQWAASQNKLLQGNKTKCNILSNLDQIKNIKGVLFGKVTATMKKACNKQLEPYKCVSFIFQKRTFDIYCPDQKDSMFWLPGISFFINQQRPQHTHPNYTNQIQKYIKKVFPAKKDQYHQNTGYYSPGRVLWKRTLLKMQHLYLKNKKGTHYKNTNAGAVIEFNKAIIKKQNHRMKGLPPTGKQSKASKQKSVSQLSKAKS